MRVLAALGLIGGLGVTTLLVLTHGVARIWDSIERLGWTGLAAVLAAHLGLIALMGSAWWLLGHGRPDARWHRFVWARLIRDSAAEALPLSQVGGFVLGARAATLAGLSSAFAAASTVVDVTAELVGQLAYTCIGLALLEYLRPHNAYAAPALAGVAIMTCLAAVFIGVQARGAGLVERLGRRLAAQFLGSRTAQSDAVQTQIRRMHARPRVLIGAALAHLVCWLLSGCETWLTLHLMHAGLSLAATLVIDSLLYGIRSVAFLVPNALGVQEASLVLLGMTFGLAPDAALALSLIKRGRDLLIAILPLMVWQGMEGRRAMAGLTPGRRAEAVLTPAAPEP